MSASERKPRSPIAERFRGFLPVVIDVETGGFDPQSHALLEIAGCILEMDDQGNLMPGPVLAWNVAPFPGSQLDAAALEFTGIDPYNPLRGAVSEEEALRQLFGPIRKSIKATGCNRAILVGHNARFDHSFLFAAASRCEVSRNPFHPFSTLDTVSLAALAYGHTVLARTCELAGIGFDNQQAHSASYDTGKTAELFCDIVNRWRDLGGWQIQPDDA